MKKKNFKPTIISETEIMETKEYNVFVLDSRNRPINESKVISFMNLFKKGKNFMHEFPAIVDDNFTVLDGQHRFEACKRLGLPFFFRWTNKLSIANVVDVQSNAGWTTKDFLHSFVKQENMNYIICQRFLNKYNLPITTAVMLLGSKTSSDRGGLGNLGFYDGNFVVINESNAHVIAEAVIDIYERGFKGAKQRTFVSALAKCMRHPEYSHKQMIEKIDKYGASLLRNQVNTEEYLRNLELVYNYKQPSDTKIRFL